MKFFIVFFFVFTLQQSISSAQPRATDYRSRIAAIQKNISRFFYDTSAKYYKEFDKIDTADKKQYSYLWPLCALIQAANETEALNLQTISMKSVLKNIADYTDDSPPVPGYGAYIIKLGKEERFYDDNQWIGIACLDAYKRTGEKIFLEEGLKIYRFMMTGYDTAAGGGLYWKEGSFTTKNTCSNGPGIIVALQLYTATKDKKYLITALSLYRWTNKNLLSPKGIYYDNIKLPSRSIDSAVYTYNTGTMIQSNIMLYEITRNKKYLAEAKRLTESSYIHFFKNNRFPKHAWFNAVLLRGYLALHKYYKDTKYINAFITDSEAVWNSERDSRNLLGTQEKKELIEQAAMLEIYARLMNFIVHKQ